jgi:hypothetical protein
VRACVVAVILALGLAGGAVTVALAQTGNGLPAYTKGFTTWTKLNRKPVAGGSAAHAGVKNVYASRPRTGTAFPNGTVIVKTVAVRGARGPAAQVAVMRKRAGRWQWVEYGLSGDRYANLRIPASVCTGCHVGARSRDWVFTRR